MKEFVLPPLKTSTKGSPQWCSQVTLPSATSTSPAVAGDSLAAGKTAGLPTIDKGRRRQELHLMRRKVVALEFAVELDHLHGLEEKMRAVICGREYEKRYRMLWKHQEEKVRIERETAVIEARKLALERARYTRFVRDCQDQARLLHLEVTTRTHVCTEEADARRLMTLSLELTLLKVQRQQAEEDIDEAEHIFHEFQDVRDWECRLAQGSLYPTKVFDPELHLVQERNIGTGGYRGRTDLLMDYTVCEEEWEIRLSLLSEERVARLPLEWEHSAALLMSAEEPLARKTLKEAFLYGRCQAYLGAGVRIQRWWRMLRRMSWRNRSLLELRRCVSRRRNQMTARDYRSVLERMKRQLAVSVLSLEEVYKSMNAVENAVEVAYQYIFDYHLYTLMNRAANLQDTEAYRLRSHPLEDDDGIVPIPPPTSLVHVPYRLYVRKYPFQPYDLWRAQRWIEGSTIYMREVKLQEEAEMQMRELLLQCEAREAETLCVYQAALKGGTWMWRSLYSSILFIEGEENVSRGLTQGEERDGRSILGVVAAGLYAKHLSLTESRLDLQREEDQRLAIADEERVEFTRITEGDWRWKNLLRLYMKRGGSRCNNAGSQFAPLRDMTRRYASLDAVACIIKRFFQVVLARNHLTTLRLASQGTERLRRTAARMRELLASEICEDAKDVVPTTNTTEDGSDGAVGEETAYEMGTDHFSAWFDEVARQPMEREYKAIVARFQRSHEKLFRAMHFLFAVVRGGRERIERRENQERELLRRSSTFFAIMKYELSLQEVSHRQTLIAEVEEEIKLKWRQRFELLITCSKCCVNIPREAVASLLPNAAQRSRTLVVLPRMDCTKRLFSREEVVRTRITTEERLELSATLLSLHSIVSVNVVQHEEEEERAAACKQVDNCWPTHPPLAQLALLVSQEVAKRRDLESLVWNSYTSLLVRGCGMYAEQAFEHFVRGHLSFSSEARYFDRHLTELLLQRVAFVERKLCELEAAEVCARSRIEYMEKLHRGVHHRQ